MADQEAFDAARTRLVEHPLYAELTTPDRVRTFMKHHVFAVWDFFTLLKRLQREVTTVEIPWTPKVGFADHGRFIMEIVLAEETDEDADGGHISHFELYRRAMEEFGADTTLIDAFVERLGEGVDARTALSDIGAPDHVQHFVRHTLDVALDGAPHEVAASFCHGRENLLPDVLGAVLDNLGEGAVSDAPTFKHYLDRHIELDHGEHGPLALKLLDKLCAGDPQREADAVRVGTEAIEARSALWDGVLADVLASEPAAAPV